MKLLRRLLLVICAIGFAAGVWLAVVALLPPSAPEVTASLPASGAVPDDMIAVAAASVSAERHSAAAGPVEIDALEVSVAAYQACVRAGACPLHVTAAGANIELEWARGLSTGCAGGGLNAPEEPINCVDYAAAEAYCKWVGKRLPTSDEWWVAFAPRHREAFQELHRKRARRSMAWAEWTSTPVTLDGDRRAENILRRTVTFRPETAPADRVGQPAISRAALGDRSSDLGFRCAR